jgi:hypothetical protein
MLERAVRKLSILISCLLIDCLFMTCALSRAWSSADVVVFKTGGASFSAILTVKPGAAVQWTFPDGSVSSEARLVKSFGSSEDRLVELKVTPWSGVQAVNIGYDGADDGPATVEKLEGQSVVSVAGLHNLAPFLKSWSSSNASVAVLDFRDFVNLELMECYHCDALAEIGLANTPNLRRVNIEGGKVAILDLSESPQLEDLRASLNPFRAIHWGKTGARLWHLCARDLTNGTVELPDMKQFPRLKQLWIWDSGQSGGLKVESPQLSSVIASDNGYTSLDLSGQFPAGRDAYVEVNDNALTKIDIAEDPGLLKLHARHNALDREAVDAILRALDGYGAANGVLDLNDNSAPSSEGMAHVESLIRRGWKVKVAR